MRLRKVLFGAFSGAFLFFILQGVRLWLAGVGASFVCNQNGAFSVVIPSSLLFFVALGALFLFGVQWWQEESFIFSSVWFVLFISGISNLTERLLYGCVTDYIYLWSLPVFNLADVLLTIGASILFWKLLKK